MHLKKLVFLFLLLFAQDLFAQDSLPDVHLQELDYFKLRTELDKNTTLDKETRLYYTSLVDNAFNRNELAIAHADSFKRIKSNRWTGDEIIRLNEMLLDSYFKAFRYREAAATADVLMQQYQNTDLAALQNMRDICYGLINAPAQRAVIRDATNVPVIRNQIGLWEIPVQFKNTQEQFLFDTGANISTISESYAIKLGLRLTGKTVKVNGGQGKRVDAQLGVADSLHIGNMSFYNVVFLVMPDEVLQFPQVHFNINGIIGFPVINAMKEVHITRQGRLTVPKDASVNSLNNMALNGFTPLVRAVAEDDTLIFQFDTGAANTNLFSNYYNSHRQLIADRASKDHKHIGSVGGARKMKVYELPSMNIYVGGNKAFVRDVAVYTQDIFSAGKGIAMGNMGQDVINQFSELVLNFKTMSLEFKN